MVTCCTLTTMTPNARNIILVNDIDNV